MKSRTGYVKKLIYLIDFLRSNDHPSGKAIEDFMQEKGFPFGEDTRRRFFRDINDDFGLVIEWNRTQGGFYIAEDHEDFDEESADRLYRFLDFADRSSFVVESVTEAKSILDFVDFGSAKLQVGRELISDVLRATKERREVFFRYKAYYEERSKSHNFQPYLLKEYAGRWYMVGYETSLKAIRTYALDRVVELEVKAQSFKPKNVEAVRKQLDSVVGMNYSDSNVEVVVIKYYGYQVNYQESLPLHHSAQLVERNEGDASATFSYLLAPNFELEQSLLRLGDQAEVLEPKRLRQRMVQLISDAADRYS